MDDTTTQLTTIARHATHYRTRGMSRLIPREYAKADELLDHMLEQRADSRTCGAPGLQPTP